MGTNIDTPPPRDYGAETRDTLQAQLDLAPQQFAAQSQFAPQYQALNQRLLEQSLTGSAGQRGLLDIYEKNIYPTLSRVEAADRQARVSGELGTIQQYAPQVTQTLREASGNAPLLAEFNKQALGELQAGTQLDPAQAAQLAQATRSAQAARGFGFGTPDVTQEAFTLGERGLALQNQRRQFASGVVGLNQATGGDPFMAILGRPSQTLGMGQGFGAQGQSFNPGGLFNPESTYAADIYNTNYNAEAAANIATGNNKAALQAAGISAAGSILGGAASAGKNL